MIVISVGSLLCATSTNLTQLVTFRFITGLDMGAPLATVTALITELSPQRWRNLLVAITVVGIPLGGMIGAAVAQHHREGRPRAFGQV